MRGKIRKVSLVLHPERDEDFELFLHKLVPSGPSYSEAVYALTETLSNNFFSQSLTEMIIGAICSDNAQLAIHAEDVLDALERIANSKQADTAGNPDCAAAVIIYYNNWLLSQK